MNALTLRRMLSCSSVNSTGVSPLTSFWTISSEGMAVLSGREVEVADDALGIGVSVIGLAVQHEAVRPWHRADPVPSQEVASLLRGCDLLAGDSVRMADAPNDLLCGAAQEDGKHLSAVLCHGGLVLLEC